MIYGAKVTGKYMKLLVTGSSGFVGSRVVEMASDNGLIAVSVVRKEPKEESSGRFHTVSSIDADTDWSGAFDSIDCVVHCAARVHQMKESESDALAAYREINTLGTLNLARQASRSGIKRFVFLSSIKVNGEFTLSGSLFEPNLKHAPQDPYGLSKYEAELGLIQLAKETGLEVVIIRPPLVYGPGVKANFNSLMQWVDRGIPLPLGAIHNQRSLVYRDNLVDLILHCCVDERAAGETFLVSDGKDVSTTELIFSVTKAMNKTSKLIPIPMGWITCVAKLFGKPQVAQRICSNLQVDMSHTEKVLGWKPPISFEDGIEKTAQAYLDSR